MEKFIHMHMIPLVRSHWTVKTLMKCIPHKTVIIKSNMLSVNEFDLKTNIRCGKDIPKKNRTIKCLHYHKRKEVIRSKVNVVD